MRPPRILHDDEVTIVYTVHGQPDGDGVPQETTTEHAWKNVNVQQQGTDWDDDNQNLEVVTYRVSGGLPPVDPQAGDTIKWEGDDYTVIGKPDKRTGRHRINHTSLTMRAAKG